MSRVKIGKTKEKVVRCRFLGAAHADSSWPGCSGGHALEECPKGCSHEVKQKFIVTP
jgi:hypothetical protein